MFGDTGARCWGAWYTPTLSTPPPPPGTVATSSGDGRCPTPSSHACVVTRLSLAALSSGTRRFGPDWPSSNDSSALLNVLGLEEREQSVLQPHHFLFGVEGRPPDLRPERLFSAG